MVCPPMMLSPYVRAMMLVSHNIVEFWSSIAASPYSRTIIGDGGHKTWSLARQDRKVVVCDDDDIDGIWWWLLCVVWLHTHTHTHTLEDSAHVRCPQPPPPSSHSHIARPMRDATEENTNNCRRLYMEHGRCIFIYI